MIELDQFKMAVFYETLDTENEPKKIQLLTVVMYYPLKEILKYTLTE